MKSWLSNCPTFSFCIWIFHSRKQLYIHQCLFVHLSVSLSTKPPNSIKSFISPYHNIHHQSHHHTQHLTHHHTQHHNTNITTQHQKTTSKHSITTQHHNRTSQHNITMQHQNTSSLSILGLNPTVDRRLKWEILDYPFLEFFLCKIHFLHQISLKALVKPFKWHIGEVCSTSRNKRLTLRSHKRKTLYF